MKIEAKKHKKLETKKNAIKKQRKKAKKERALNDLCTTNAKCNKLIHSISFPNPPAQKEFLVNLEGTLCLLK
jgi:hypothetical protein